MVKKIGILFVLGLIYLPGYGQSILEYTSQWDQYLIQNLTVEDGLRGEQITYAYEDDEGFIWLLSSSGPSRYDGLSLKPFYKGYTGGFMYEFHEDSNGNLWIPATSAGVYKFNRDSSIQYNQELEAPNGLAKSMIITKNDTMYIGSYGEGLLKFHNSAVHKKYTTADGLIGNSIWTVFEDSKGKIWIGTNEGLSILDNGVFTNFTIENGLPYNTIRGIKEMYNGDVWVGTDKEGIVVFRDYAPHKTYHIKDGLSGSFPQYFAQNPMDSSIWIGDHGAGVDRFKDGRFENINESTGLVSNLVMYIGFTESGLGIIGTENGVSILRKRTIDVIDERIEGIENVPFLSVIEGVDNTIWLGTEGRGFLYKQAANWNGIENPPVHSNGYSNGAAIDRKENVWFSTQGSGLIRVNKNFEVDLHLSTEDGIADEFVNGMAFDESNYLWTCTNSGVDRLDENYKVIEHYDSQNGMENEYCFSSLYDSKGNFWAGTYGGGLYRIKDQVVTRYDTSNGLKGLSVYSIFEHSSGRVFVSTDNGGISEFNGIDFDFYGSEYGVSSNTMYSMEEDEEQNMWFSSNHGIYFYSSEDIRRLSLDLQEPVRFQHYTTEDGLPTNSMEATSNATTATIHTGEMLFATSNGVAVLNPKHTRLDQTNFKTYVDELFVNNQIKDIAESVILTPDENKVEIVYSALNFESPKKTKFRVRLEGIDEDWVYVQNRTTTYYDFLPDGDYVFHVSAIGPDGQWSNKTASLNFTVLPPFYKTWWFIGLCLLGFVGMGAGGVYWRSNLKLQALNRELETQHKIQKERERISRELHDNVGSQISNLITGIEISNLHVKSNQQNKALSLLDNLDSDARAAMTDLRETIWLLDKEKVEFGIFLDHLNGYLNRQKRYLKEMNVEVHSTVDPQFVLSPDRSLNLTRIIQEALNNANKYANASLFRIECDQKNQQISIEISDNGVGMETDAEIGAGNGLVNMRERAELMNAALLIESKQGAGTKITLEFS